MTSRTVKSSEPVIVRQVFMLSIEHVRVVLFNKLTYKDGTCVQLNTGLGFDSGITVSNRFVKIRFTCRVKGNRVLMQGIFYGNSTAVEGQNHAVANISSNIKPSTQIDTIACIQDGNYHYLGSACLTVTANNIQVSSNISMAGRYVQFSVSYDL